MVSKHKLLAMVAAGSFLTASFLGIQTYYTTSYTADAAATQVAVRTPITQSSEIFGGGYESTSAVTKQTATAIPLASSTTGSLQSSLESEAAERKTQDEKISKSIGAINNTLLGYIGSASTSNIGDGTLRGAIGNTSIAGIGAENNLSSAIKGLDTDMEDLMTKMDSNTAHTMEHGTGINIPLTYAKETVLAKCNLEPNSRYIVLASADLMSGSDKSIMSLSLHLDNDVNLKDYYFGFPTRTTASNGGGLSIWGYVETGNESRQVSCGTYLYENRSVQARGKIMAIKLH